MADTTSVRSEENETLSTESAQVVNAATASRSDSGNIEENIEESTAHTDSDGHPSSSNRSTLVSREDDVIEVHGDGDGDASLTGRFTFVSRHETAEESTSAAHRVSGTTNESRFFTNEELITMFYGPEEETELENTTAEGRRSSRGDLGDEVEENVNTGSNVTETMSGKKMVTAGPVYSSYNALEQPDTREVYRKVLARERARQHQVNAAERMEFRRQLEEQNKIYCRMLEERQKEIALNQVMIDERLRRNNHKRQMDHFAEKISNLSAEIDRLRSRNAEQLRIMRLENEDRTYTAVAATIGIENSELSSATSTSASQDENTVVQPDTEYQLPGGAATIGRVPRGWTLVSETPPSQSENTVVLPEYTSSASISGHRQGSATEPNASSPVGEEGMHENLLPVEGPTAKIEANVTDQSIGKSQSAIAEEDNGRQMGIVETAGCSEAESQAPTDEQVNEERIGVVTAAECSEAEVHAPTEQVIESELGTDYTVAEIHASAEQHMDDTEPLRNDVDWQSKTEEGKSSEQNDVVEEVPDVPMSSVVGDSELHSLVGDSTIGNEVAVEEEKNENNLETHDKTAASGSTHPTTAIKDHEEMNDEQAKNTSTENKTETEQVVSNVQKTDHTTAKEDDEEKTDKEAKTKPTENNSASEHVLSKVKTHHTTANEDDEEKADKEAKTNPTENNSASEQVFSKVKTRHTTANEDNEEKSDKAENNQTQQHSESQQLMSQRLALSKVKIANQLDKILQIPVDDDCTNKLAATLRPDNLEPDSLPDPLPKDLFCYTIAAFMQDINETIPSERAAVARRRILDFVLQHYTAFTQVNTFTVASRHKPPCLIRHSALVAITDEEKYIV